MIEINEFPSLFNEVPADSVAARMSPVSNPNLVGNGLDLDSLSSMAPAARHDAIDSFGIVRRLYNDSISKYINSDFYKSIINSKSI